jgi:hypothetical protein
MRDVLYSLDCAVDTACFLGVMEDNDLDHDTANLPQRLP